MNLLPNRQPQPQRRLLFVAAFWGLFAVGQAIGGESRQVFVVVDKVSDFQASSAQVPIYYVPLIGGFKEDGALLGNADPPAERDILNRLGAMLEAQHFLLSTDSRHPTTIALAISWGYCNPVTMTLEDGTVVRMNEHEMMALVAGRTFGNGFGDDFDRLVEESHVDRYFLTISAIDYPALLRRERKVLWVARASVRSGSLQLENVLPALIKSAGPHLAHETLRRPAIESIELVPNGRVVTGTPVVVPATTQPAAQAPRP